MTQDDRAAKPDWTDQDLLTKDIAGERLEEAIGDLEASGNHDDVTDQRLRVMREQLGVLRNG